MSRRTVAKNQNDIFPTKYRGGYKESELLLDNYFSGHFVLLFEDGRDRKGGKRERWRMTCNNNQENVLKEQM